MRELRSWIILGCALAWCACSESGVDGASPDAAGLDADTAADAQVSDDAGMQAPACDSVAPTACPEPSPRYADVEPIIAKRCVICHNGTADAWPLTSYQHVADWFGEVRAAMLTCTMPPVDSGLSMPMAERQLILEWIRCGFPR